MTLEELDVLIEECLASGLLELESFAEFTARRAVQLRTQ